MEYSSNREDDDFVLKLSDDEYSNGMDQTDKYGKVALVRQCSKRCESSQSKPNYAQLQRENYLEFTSVKANEAFERKNKITIDEDRNTNISSRISSKHSTSPRVSRAKQQGISQNLANDNISDKMVNFSKLIKQLLNAKVVIERMCENSGTNEQFVEKRAMSSGSRIMDSVQVYCPKCQTMTIVTHRVSAKKSCSKCDSTLKYLCSKCNKNHYEHYENLCRHYRKCELSDSTLKKLNPSDFLVKKIQIDFSKRIIRYCLACDEVDESCSRWAKRACENCEQKLLYQCSKCKAQYTTDNALLYHMQTRCYPHNLYKCKKCEFTSLVWERMRQHVIKVHLRENSINEPHTQPLSAKVVLRKPEESVTEDAGPRPDDSSGEANGKEYNTQRYCTTCKKTIFGRIDDTIAKNCSECNTAMAYLCTKCNKKYYKRYSNLLSHLDRCKETGDATDTMENDVDYKSKFTLDRNQFIVKEFQTVSSTEKWTRYCPTCEFVTARPNDRRCSCGENLTYVCKKCNVKCSNYDKITYHAENYCFPTHQYKCIHCEFSKTGWKKMKEHFESKHADLPLIKCEFCSYETIYEYRLKWHEKLVHRKNVKKFCCSNCSYSTNFKKNLQRHVKMNH